MPDVDQMLCDLIIQAYASTAPFDFNIKGVKVYIYATPDGPCVTFPGTEDASDFWKDFAVSTYEGTTIDAQDLGEVYGGFDEGMQETTQAILGVCQPAYIIGHSLGSAHAENFAARCLFAGQKFI